MQSIKILIVEDELLIAESLAIKLKKLNYQIVDIVSSGKAAIAKTELHNPDLILMDIAIKGALDGIETAKLIEQSQQNVAIVFLTAYADDKTIERASTTSCYGYVLKPFNDKELHATIKIALKQKQEKAYIETSLSEITELLGEYSAEKNHIYEDRVTKLPNQLMLKEIFAYLLAEMERYSQVDESQTDRTQFIFHNKLIAVAYLKLYKFERIVNSLDNESNDLLIEAIAKKLTESVEASSYPGAAIKLTSHKFAMLLAGIEQRQIASNFFDTVLAKLREPIIIKQKKIFVTASIGISFYPFDNCDVERLLEQAKQAMIYVENQNGNKCQLYTSAFRIMNSNATDNLSLEADLHQAIERNQLKLYYQPKVSLKTGKLEGAEALLRWHHPQLGIVFPQKILHLAEASGLIDRIDKWVLQQVCHQLKKWHQSKFKSLKVAVNISDNHFNKLDLFHQLTRLLFELNINPQYLELELKEQALVENIQNNIQKLNAIINLGVQFTLDDFGTGYSSLGYLHQFPFNTLKIDRCFLQDINHNSKNSVITQSVIKMAHNLGLKVVAEGLETEAELKFLIKHQCDAAQGNLFAYPLPVEEFEKLMATGGVFIRAASKNSSKIAVT